VTSWVGRPSGRGRRGGLGLALAGAIALVLAAPAPTRAAPYAAIVIDAGTGQVLHARSADEPRYPASLTKIMTAYMTFEAVRDGRLSWQQALPVSRHAAGMPPSRLGLRTGERVQVEDALLALVTKSANDAAVVLAEAIGGTESSFARLMTKKARALGLQHTTFRNASGLPDRQQVTTARDMALLGRALVRAFPREYALFATASFDFRGHRLVNHNRLLGRVEGVDGIKTGYIRASGFNLVASAERDGRRVIAAVFGGKSSRTRDSQTIELLEMGFRRLPAVPMLGPPMANPLRGLESGATAVAGLPGAGPALHGGRLDPGAPPPLPRGKPVIDLDLIPRLKPYAGGLASGSSAGAESLAIDDLLDLR
jgi:D-alanyl-D-alanine carboxypeptidase